MEFDMPVNVIDESDMDEGRQYQEGNISNDESTNLELDNIDKANELEE